MKQVREVVTISGWSDNTGWTYKNQVLSDQIITIYDDFAEEMDWDWWELNDPVEGEDVAIKVSYYPADWDWYNDGDIEAIAEYEIWESAIRAEREAR